MTNAPRKFIFRFVDPKGRLAIASLIAIAVYLLTFPLETGLRISLAYDLAIASFLALHAYRINRITAQDIQDYYQDREPSNRFVVTTAVVFSSLSMVGVGFMADISKNWTSLHKKLHTVSSLVAIVLSWILLHVFYAFYYAHQYYDVDEDDPCASRQERVEFSQRRATRLLGFSLLRLHDRHVLSNSGCDGEQSIDAADHSLPCRHLVPVRDRHPGPGDQHSLQ